MKKILAALALSACAAAPAFAADCALTVEANDMMQFNTKSITVPKECKNFSLTLKHVGKMPKTAMGHNLVVTTAADLTAVNADGMKAGAASDYIKKDDARVIAHTKVVGGGESTTIEFPVAKIKAGTDYSFFCSFPGHAGMMKGSLKLGA
ncbi:MAG: azurin [Comamonas sp.]|uniref:azurin n=2 Tax=Comamonas sp. TaxID=34028 RepID=UPI002FCA4B8D